MGSVGARLSTFSVGPYGQRARAQQENTGALAAGSANASLIRLGTSGRLPTSSFNHFHIRYPNEEPVLVARVHSPAKLIHEPPRRRSASEYSILIRFALLLPRSQV
jgi:hypothetical protein